MHHIVHPTAAAPATLKDVYDRLAGAPELSDNRRRDLRSALSCYAKLMQQPLEAIRLDLTEIRKTLDGIVPAQAKVSRKRWANLRSDLGAAVAASGLHPMLSTTSVPLTGDWELLLAGCSDQGIAAGLSRLARWASLRQVSPVNIDTTVLDRFIGEIESMTLVRNPQALAKTVAKTWNRVVASAPLAGLQVVAVPASRAVSDRLA
jgi:hypothetical protein